MARVTVEDCLDKVGSRFELVLLAAKRARQLAMGRDALVEWENDKPTVVALREIAEGKITAELLNELEKAHKEAEEFLLEGAAEEIGEEIPAEQAKAAEPAEQPQAGAEPGEQPQVNAEASEQPQASAEASEQPQAGTAETGD